MNTIHFVGAGSGAPDLITVRGMRLLQEADVVVYAGSLVSPELLQYTGEQAEIFNRAEMYLEQVIEVMTGAFREGRKVVRLHSGDPSLYGAVREQMDALKAQGIPIEVCPGVSSFAAAAASLQAEYTLPGVSQTVILTRRAGRTPVPEREGIRELASHGASMVVFLSISMIRELQEELLAAGTYTEDTPCAVVYKASWPEEKKVVGTLADIAEKVHAAEIGRTALITVGRFLGDEYALSKLYDRHFTHGYREAKD